MAGCPRRGPLQLKVGWTARGPQALGAPDSWAAGVPGRAEIPGCADLLGYKGPDICGAQGTQGERGLGVQGAWGLGGPGVRTDSGAVRAAGVPTPGREPPVPAPPGNIRGKRPAPTRADTHGAGLGALKERTPSGPGSRAALRRRSRATPSPAPERGRAGEGREASALRLRSSLQDCGASAPPGRSTGGRAATSSWGAGLVLGAGPPSAGGRGSWGRKRCWMGGTCRPEGCVWWAGFVPMGGA